MPVGSMSVESAPHIHLEEHTLRPHTGIDYFVCGYHWIWKEKDSAFAGRNGTSCMERGDVDVENKNNARPKHPARDICSSPTHVTVCTVETWFFLF